MNKKAVLSQRWRRNAPYVWMPWKFSGLHDYGHGYFSQFFSWAFTSSWVNRGSQKNLGQSLTMPTLPISAKKLLSAFHIGLQTTYLCALILPALILPEFSIGILGGGCEI